MTLMEHVDRWRAWASLAHEDRCEPPRLGSLVEGSDDAHGLRSGIWRWDGGPMPYLYGHWADTVTSAWWAMGSRVSRWMYVPISAAMAMRIKFGLANVVDVLRGGWLYVVDDAGHGKRRACRVAGTAIPTCYVPPRACGRILSHDLAVRRPEHRRVTNVCGIAGFMSRAEAEAVLEAAPEWLPVGMGVLASKKTLYEGGNRHPLRYPRRADIAGIFVDHPRAENLIHYASDTTGPGLMEELADAHTAGGENCHGLQVNVAWPSWEALLQFKCLRPQARVILQVKLTGGVSDGFVTAKLHQYKSCIDGVLLDASGGIGIPIHIVDVLPVVESIAIVHPDLRVGIAGGLSGPALAQQRAPMVAIMRRYPWLSIDAESGLRDKAEGGGNLLIDEATAYTTMAASLWRDALDGGT